MRRLYLLFVFNFIFFGFLCAMDEFEGSPFKKRIDHIKKKLSSKKKKKRSLLCFKKEDEESGSNEGLSFFSEEEGLSEYKNKVTTFDENEKVDDIIFTLNNVTKYIDQENRKSKEEQEKKKDIKRENRKRRNSIKLEKKVKKKVNKLAKNGKIEELLITKKIVDIVLDKYQVAELKEVVYGENVE